MDKEIRARFSGGKIEVLEKVDLEEGGETLLTVRKSPSPVPVKYAFQRAAGAWKGTFDIDAYLKDLYADRRRRASDSGP